MVCPQDRSLIRYGPDYARSAVCNRDAALNRCGSDAAVTWTYPPLYILIIQSMSIEGSANFDQRYAERTRRSAELFADASKIVPGGAGSSARTAKFGWKPYPPFIAGGAGARITDVDGNSYVDYLLGLGPMILGHRHPVVTEAVTRAITEFGTCPGLPYELEMEAAAKVVDAVPGVEMVRFSSAR